MIQLDDRQPHDLYPYLETARGEFDINGKARILNKQMPIYFGQLAHLNTSLDYLLICSDLQGMNEINGEKVLMGLPLAEYLRLYIDELDVTLPEPKVGVFLCGDLFTSPEKRGTGGDVRPVWRQFNKHFEWVVGVAGNHDRFGEPDEKSTFQQEAGIHLLHQEQIEIAGFRIGGVSGIIGQEDKPQRMEEKAYLTAIQQQLKKPLDFLLIHQHPDFPEYQYPGHIGLRTYLEQGMKTKICCGHSHWERTLVALSNGSQLINADGKIIILKLNQAE
ncbi:MAG: metallophosphoesterase [Bacteroidota bacterium]